MATVPEWITQSVSLFTSARPGGEASAPTPEKSKTERSTHERLQATLRRGEESLSPRALRYLALELVDGRPVHAVARFHLGNGARVERIHWAGDGSAKGHKQSYGLMVNYLYDLKRIDKYRDGLAQGKIAASREVEKLATGG